MVGVQRVVLQVIRRAVGHMESAFRFYATGQSPTAEVDYGVGLREDLYLILGSLDRAGDGSP